MIIRCLTVLTLFYAHSASPQGKNLNPSPDSLKGKDFDYIFSHIEDPDTPEAKRYYYMKAFVIKAKAEKNYRELSEGYKNYVHFGSEKDWMKYADSMVSAAKYTRDNSIIGGAYLSKGIAHYGHKELAKALDYYLIADSYISKTQDQYLIYKAKYNIAQIKHLLGYYDEAIVLLKDCILFLKNEDKHGYLDAMHSLGLCYNKAGDFGDASAINKQGILESAKLRQPEMIAYFTLAEGINQCDMQNYGAAIKTIASVLHKIPDHDFGNRTVGLFHIGKSYWMLGREDEAIQYFQKVDKAYSNNNYIRPDLREAYELMITYYKERGNVEAHLHYIEVLLEVDKRLYKTFWYLQGKIAKEYDTKELQREKSKIEHMLARRKENETIFAVTIVFLVILTATLIVRHIKARKNFRRKYDLLLQKLEASQKPKSRDDENLDINEDAVLSILGQLRKFEESKKFLDKNLNQTKLAVQFDTNTTYLSKIIVHHRGKKFPEYINDLRIDYIAQRIRDEKILRKYNNKALAEEAGFTSTPRFVNAFFAKTGITPTFFIEQLIRDETIAISNGT